MQRAVVLDNSGLTEQELLDQLTGGSMTYVQTVYSDGGWSSSSYPFEEKVARAVLEAVLRDIDAGRAGGVMFTADGWEQTCQNSLEFWYTQEDGLNSMNLTSRRPIRRPLLCCVSTASSMTSGSC